jgi:hypothetical protein
MVGSNSYRLEHQMKRLIRRAAVATAFAGAVALPALPASAAPVITGGLVNVTIVDLVSGNQITAQVPVSVAANICDVSVAVLTQDLRDGTADCSTDTQIITLSAQRR